MTAQEKLQRLIATNGAEEISQLLAECLMEREERQNVHWDWERRYFLEQLIAICNHILSKRQEMGVFR